MAYEILKFRGEFNKEGLLTQIEVQVKMSKNDIRDIYATNKPCAGYRWLLPSDKISEQLLQEVAAGGQTR